MDTPPPPWLHGIADALDEALWTWDAATGSITLANAAFRRLFGAPPDQHGARLFLDHAHASDRDALSSLRAGLPGQGYSTGYRMVLPPGSPRAGRLAHLQEHAVPGHSADGRLVVAHVLRDLSWQHDTSVQLRDEITRRTDAERDLDDATQRLQALIASANDAVVTIDESSRIIDWNAAAERMFGWQRDEVLGRILTETIVPHVHRGAHHVGIGRYLQSGQSQMFGRRVETQGLRRDGHLFDVELSVWPVRIAGRQTFSSFIRDISRRKAAEKALGESEAKYRTVVENVSEGILVTAAGRIVYLNSAALALTGVSEQEALANPFTAFLHPEDRELVLGNHMRRLRGEPVANRYQFRVVHVSGAVRWVELGGVVVEWQGAPATLNFLTDVTQRKLAEEELQKALARERELSDMKSRFVAVASHEFRTPLAAILSSVELLEDHGTTLPEADRREVMGLVKGAVARMNGMIEQVLLTSRLESGQFVFEPQAQPLPQLLAQAVSELQQAQPQAVRIALQCEDAAAPRLLDARLVRHIVANLLGNALKYSPPDTPVRCHVRVEGETLHLEVADQGIGIPAPDLPRLFERFHRAGNVGNIQGTGIGLHVVRECVQLHGGRISVDSTPGAGTTFRVQLHAPLAE